MLSAQCFKKNYVQGEKHYNKKEYSKALQYFSVALDCPDASANSKKLVQKKIADCKAKMSQRQPAKPAPKPEEKPADTPTAKKPRIQRFNASMRIGCFHSRQGIEVTADFYAENLKGQSIYAECIVRPKESTTMSDRYRGTEFDVHGMPGQKGRILGVETGYENFTDVFFVPFAAMDLQNYEEQPFDIILNIYQEDSPDSPISGGTFSGGVLTEPITLYVDNDITDRRLYLDYQESMESFDIKVCGGLQWLDVPSWIETTQASIFVTENESTSPRSAVLTIKPRDGGNSVRVHVSQEGRPAQAVVAQPQVEINNVRLEHNVIGGDGRRKTVFHVDVDIRGKKDSQVQVCALYYNADGTTQLLDANGTWVTASTTVTPSHDNSNFSDVRFMVDNMRIFKAKNLQRNEVKIFVAVSFDGGNSWAAQSDVHTVTW
ncbi:MAG: BACON domain-containing protein [Bacteroidales bacterium]|nr:BACON domain-containing protein [Bacteroidales bacterium]